MAEDQYEARVIQCQPNGTRTEIRYETSNEGAANEWAQDWLAQYQGDARVSMFVGPADLVAARVADLYGSASPL